MTSPVTVAFPLTGKHLPDFPCSPEEFLDQVVRDVPHWIYHLRVHRSDRGSFYSRFGPVSADTLREFAYALGLSGAFEVEPLEFVHGAMPKPGQHSEYAF